MMSKVLELIVLLAILGVLIYVGVKVVPTIGVINTQSMQDIVKDIQGIVKDQDIIKELAVCVIAVEPTNPVYHNLPTTTTQLVCDGPLGAFRGNNSSLGELYADGWSLIQVVDPSIEITEQKEINEGKEKTVVELKRRAYAAIYLERVRPR